MNIESNSDDYPIRKPIRANFIDYSCGLYFVTICTRDKKHYFGTIRDGNMYYSTLGKYCHNTLLQIKEHYPYVEIPHLVVMPNHLHLIIEISSNICDLDKIVAKRSRLSVIIGGFKQAVTKFARHEDIEFNWQSRFYDHSIRNQDELNHIIQYIENNVYRWDSDIYYL